MIVRIDGQAFAIPVAQIESASALEIEPEDADPPGEETGNRLSARVRGQKLPVVFSREILGIGESAPATWPKLLVVRTDGSLVGLVVDAIEGTEELVIKPLCNLLAGHPLISGTSQSESGEVISILNLSGLRRWVSGGPMRHGLEDSPGARRERTTTGPEVLVVDDSISVRKGVARQLRAMGLRVDEVSDGLEALGRLRNLGYALVVTDLEMPRLDGFGLLAEMRTDRGPGEHPGHRGEHEGRPGDEAAGRGPGGESFPGQARRPVRAGGRGGPSARCAPPVEPRGTCHAEGSWTTR